MPRNKLIITLGLLVAMLPILGFPHRWEAFFEILAGLAIVGLSVWSVIDKKLTLKAKAQKRQTHKRLAAQVIAQKENAPPVETSGNPIEKEWSEIIETNNP